MYSSRSGPSLSERAASSGIGSGEAVPSSASEPAVPRPFRPPPPPARPAAATQPAEHPQPTDRQRTAGRVEQGRHCWVRDPPDAPGIWPGLLVEWRLREDGWHGRVTYAVSGPRGPVLIEAWLPADQLKQG
jgi:hypothetical protein